MTNRVTEAKRRTGLSQWIANASDNQLRTLTVATSAAFMGLLFLLATIISFRAGGVARDIYRTLIAEDSSQERLRQVQEMKEVQLQEMQELTFETSESRNDSRVEDSAPSASISSSTVARQSSSSVQYLSSSAAPQPSGGGPRADRTGTSGMVGQQVGVGGDRSGQGPGVQAEGSGVGGTGSGDGTGGTNRSGRSGGGGRGTGGSGKEGDGFASLAGNICDRASKEKLDHLLAEQLNFKPGNCVLSDRWTDDQGISWTLFMVANKKARTVNLAAVKDFDLNSRDNKETHVLFMEWDQQAREMIVGRYLKGTSAVSNSGWNIKLGEKNKSESRRTRDLVNRWWTRR